jgi:hypothetical protein
MHSRKNLALARVGALRSIENHDCQKAGTLNLRKQKVPTNQKQNMKIKNDIELPPRVASRRRLTAWTAVAMLAGVAALVTFAADSDKDAAPIYVTELPPGYRDWKVVSVAHEAGDLNDIRAVLGNDIAINAYREGKLPFPEGAIVGRIAWSHVASEENNKSFGRDQSFVAGPPTKFYLQFMVKDSKKYAATGGWGYSSFDGDSKPTGAASMTGCFPCHQAVKSRDFIFTRYSP